MTCPSWPLGLTSHLKCKTAHRSLSLSRCIQPSHQTCLDQQILSHSKGRAQLYAGWATEWHTDFRQVTMFAEGFWDMPQCGLKGVMFLVSKLSKQKPAVSAEAHSKTSRSCKAEADRVADL